jgi:hypothetical protein
MRRRKQRRRRKRKRARARAKAWDGGSIRGSADQELDNICYFLDGRCLFSSQWCLLLFIFGMWKIGMSAVKLIFLRARDRRGWPPWTCDSGSCVLGMDVSGVTMGLMRNAAKFDCWDKWHGYTNLSLTRCIHYSWQGPIP